MKRVKKYRINISLFWESVFCITNELSLFRWFSVLFLTQSRKVNSFCYRTLFWSFNLGNANFIMVPGSSEDSVETPPRVSAINLAEYPPVKLRIICYHNERIPQSLLSIKYDPNGKIHTQEKESPSSSKKRIFIVALESCSQFCDIFRVKH